ncbi:MAG TPA: hypothetical protein VJ911_06865 [Cryomorphaceae bacterium]|nr:hypothetical protein [Cryomorphaceae bacterium]
MKTNRRVWLLGEIDTVPEGFEQIALDATTKEGKLVETCQILEDSFIPPARYIVRLDDDDLINPDLFDRLSKEEFDIACDTHHAFYDLSSGSVSYQKRPWIANTSIHNFKHAITKVKASSSDKNAIDKNYLVASDHSQTWHKYYDSKEVRKLKKGEPLYLRVLSPNTRSAKQSASSELGYTEYLFQFGNWKGQFPFEKELQQKLIKVWEEHCGSLKELKIPKKSILTRVANLIKSK